MYNPPLEKIRIAAPCTAEWRWMYGNDRVRFCRQCQLYVYNLSAMTTEQAEDLIRATEGRLCVRFYRRRDGSILTQNCPQGVQAIKERFRRTRTHVIAALLSLLSYTGILWWMKREPPPPVIMGGIAEPYISPPERLPLAVPIMGDMIRTEVIKRSENYIRQRALLKATPVCYTDAASHAPLVVNITISPEGEVTGAICRNASAALCRMAEEAAYRWRFQPMQADGLPAIIESRLTFSLNR